MSMTNDESARESLIREIQRLRLYHQCEEIQGQASSCTPQLAELERMYRERYGALPEIDIGPPAGPYCPPSS